MGTTEAAAVKAQMRRMPVDDMFTSGGPIRESGLMVHDMHLFRIKAPSQSKTPWDYYEHVATIPGEQAFGPEADSRCPLGKA